jgi:hypothetical protein
MLRLWGQRNVASQPEQEAGTAELARWIANPTMVTLDIKSMQLKDHRVVAHANRGHCQVI